MTAEAQASPATAEAAPTPPCRRRRATTVEPIQEFTHEQRREVSEWYSKNQADLPASVQAFMAFHQAYLDAESDLRKKLDSAIRDLRRALGITASSERRRSSGALLACVPGGVKSSRLTLEEKVAASRRLAKWHRQLKRRHDAITKALEEKLANMAKDDDSTPLPEQEMKSIEERLAAVELTKEDHADIEASGDRLVEHLMQGSGEDPALESVAETLMLGGTVLASEEVVDLSSPIPDELAGAKVVATVIDERERYDLSLSMKRIQLNVEKKVLETADGERRMLSPSTRDYGPSGFSVTWETLATLAILVGMFAMPFNRLATMFSTATKRFRAGSFGRMLHYVAERFLPIYLTLARSLSNAEILSGDDTSCRVLEVTRYFRIPDNPKPRPWAPYATPAAARESVRACEEAKQERIRRREAGDRTAKPTAQERPSLGALVGSELPFESPLRNGDGPKSALHTTVVSGRSEPDDPKSLIIFYRSHIGSFGNLLDEILRTRSPALKDVLVQGDLSSSNFVFSPALLERLNIKKIGCYAHARRPFALHEDEDPDACHLMLHLFIGLSIHEQQLDAIGRNRDNVLAVRQNDSREIWDDIRSLAEKFATTWSNSTKLGSGARYITNHFAELTAYLDDPRLEPTNNLRERMLRTEKLIEGSSMFRQSLEGRFVLDIVRTILQTAVAADVPVSDYLVSVLRANPSEVARHPERFTPRAWAAAKRAAETSAAPDRST
jgi:hypothetical protein